MKEIDYPTGITFYKNILLVFLPLIILFIGSLLFFDAESAGMVAGTAVHYYIIAFIAYKVLSWVLKKIPEMSRVYLAIAFTLAMVLLGYEYVSYSALLGGLSSFYLTKKLLPQVI